MHRLERALEKLEAQKTLLEARCLEIENRINEADLREFDHRLIQENLREFHATFSTLTEHEKPECLGLILRDVTLGKETVQLNIFDLPEFNYAESSKNRTERLLRWDSNLQRGLQPVRPSSAITTDNEV